MRFAVDEIFVGAELREIFTEATSCGYLFEVGKSYLVAAIRSTALKRAAANLYHKPLQTREPRNR